MDDVCTFNVKQKQLIEKVRNTQYQPIIAETALL